MFPVRNPTQIQDLEASEKGKGKASADGTPVNTKSREIKESDCTLTSLKNLRQNVIKIKHRRKSQFPWTPHGEIRPEIHLVLGLSEILEKHTFVGIVDTHKCLSLIQHSTNLYLVNHSSLA
jgi:DNA mismatch repair protein MLH1